MSNAGCWMQVSSRRHPAFGILHPHVSRECVPRETRATCDSATDAGASLAPSPRSALCARA